MICRSLPRIFPMLLALSGLLALGSAPLSPALGGVAEEVEKDFIRVVEQVMPSVVSIEYFLGKEPKPKEAKPGTDFIGSSGSGFIFLPKGYILTNAHVLMEMSPEKKVLQGLGADRVKEMVAVYLNDGRKLAARLIMSDVDHDLAVIKIEGDKFPAARLGDSDQLRAGQWAIAIGNPLKLKETVTVGVISAAKRPTVERPGLVLDFIQTSAPITYGNSGGPLIDIHGRVIGINTWVKTREEQIGFDSSGKPLKLQLQAQALGFAIPIRRALDIVRPYMK